MKSFAGDIDAIDTFEARFGAPLRTARSLVVPVIDLGIAEHPLNPGAELRYLDRAYLRFDGVRSSRRVVCDYEADGSLGSRQYPVVDTPDEAAASTSEQVFRLQGVEGVDPGRYVLDWQIHAMSFVLVVPEDVRSSLTPLGFDASASRFLTAAVPSSTLERIAMGGD